MWIKQGEKAEEQEWMQTKLSFKVFMMTYIYSLNLYAAHLC